MSHLEPEDVLQNLLAVAIELTGAEYAAIGVLNTDRTWLQRFVTRGIDADTHQAIGDLPRGQGVLGVLVSDSRPLRLAHVGDHPKSFGFPAAHPPMDSFLGVPILIRDEVWGNLYLTEKQGADEFTEADEQTAMVLADWAGIAIDNARLFEGVRARKDELERAVHGLEATTAIVRAIGTETDVNRVLELIVKRGRDLMKARSMVLLLVDGEDLVIAASAGQVQSRAVGSRVRIDETAVGDVLSSAKPRRTSDAPGMLRLADAGLGVDGAETGVLAPLVYRGTPLGVVAAFDYMVGDGEFDAEQESLLVTFAASAATAVATAKTVERERLRESLQAAERERRRWARELHDETLQGLAALKVLLSAANRAAPDRGSLGQTVDLAVGEIQTQINALRSLITELRPAALDEFGLEPALESLLARSATVAGLDVVSDIDLGGRRLEPELETTVYRFVQEALTNVVKHAGAEHVRVRLTTQADDIQATVADDGCGFDTDRRVDGFGLIGMHERAGLVGGTINVESSGDGTTLRGSFPMTGRTRG
ncbi:MAG: hypothetical protein QOF76_5369 [Solirubrobacteraceae bacterium]|nr:hypothetical protein [Solirubrobacteraceae bacterium]